MANPPRALVRTLDVLTGRAPLPERFGPAERRLYDRLRMIVADERVVGAAVSEKEIGGAGSGQHGIVFYVRSKTPALALDPGLLIPPVIPGSDGRSILTDVREVGQVRAQLNATMAPVCCGFSVGHRDGRAGTVAAIVRFQGTDHVLSAMHVLANDGFGSAGDAVHYPSPKDMPASPATRLGTLLPFNRLASGLTFPNEVDAALAAIDPARLGQLDPTIPGAAKPLRTVDPYEGMQVTMTGRTSGTRFSVVRGWPASVTLYYPGHGLLGFSRQAECQPFSAGGDSGSLVLDADSGAAVGLLIGGSVGQSSYFTPIKRVLAALGAKF